MAGKEESSSFRERLSQFAARFESRFDSTGSTGTQKPFRHPFLQDLRDLLVRDLTREGLTEMIKRDTRDTFRFYARNVDLNALKSLPWYRRYPQAVWKVFLALAHRLSPPRRIVFALAIFSLLAGCIQFVLLLNSVDAGNRSSGALWLAIAFAVLVMLLFMELRDKLDLKGDLEIAREIQFGLVPTEPFSRDGISIYHYMRPANTVGGDYYDHIKIDENRTAIVIGDVSGKGMPAALLMALLLGSLRTLMSAGLRGTELISKLNEYLSANIPPERLVTLFYGELDHANGNLMYINAGHNPPILIRPGQAFERLSATSMVLGISAGQIYESQTTCLQPGDQLLLFTDGITEAFNEREEEYGETRLTDFLREHAKVTPPDLLTYLVASVVKFCNSAKPSDDMTLMIITRNG